ncbi:winged helix-turn-helix transcriptional regulator [Marinivivus vitaminiproducens]|uniref:winged helix-turn-helix transcriptional regulator n=1 Tax=Marinivivus vitaminiproducens TaxID=3035935 RepID=UPI00279F1661|nr:winged helix-turn-helix transcriptional regulator [Geminicoccaceae bacterium SCSIO 64248]
MKSEKLTHTSEPTRRRRYDDACATAHALDLVGDRWALLVMRELMLGARRFGDLRANLPGISANVLTQRLEDLEASSIVVRRKLPPPASVQVYELTEWGRESEPIFQALGRWAARSPAHDPTLPFSATSLMLSMRTMLDVDRARGVDAWIRFDLGGERYLTHLHDGRLDIVEATSPAPDLVMAGEPRVVAGAIYGGQPLASLEAAGVLRIEGDRALAERYITLFPLPPKADVTVPELRVPR